MMSKKYADYMDEISADDLYKGLLSYGLFSEKLSPIFESCQFYEFCAKKRCNFSKKAYDYVRYDAMRNINTPRQLGIPVPMAYERLCQILVQNWELIRKHFHAHTDFEEHVVSRVHMMKRKDQDALFIMNYDDWRNGGSPKDDLCIGNRFIVKADISTFFPSIYTHSIPWALVGKKKAKGKTKGNITEWYDSIDEACRNLKLKETHGLLIGPHASNLISEIILCVVDHALCDKKWQYVRSIDDYTCFLKTKEQAERFLSDLVGELGKFDLILNHKKTKIQVLPGLAETFWVRKLNQFALLTSYGEVDYKQARSYFDLSIELMEESGGDAAVFKYAIKTLAGQKCTESAKKYCWKLGMHLCLIYPYLISLMEEFVFQKFDAPADEIKKFAIQAYHDGWLRRNYEECSYAIYFALLHDFEITEIKTVDVVNSADCILQLLCYLYFKKKGGTAECKFLKEKAGELFEVDMDRNWIFVYEVLSVNDLNEEWKFLKKNGVSFLQPKFHY